MIVTAPPGWVEVPAIVQSIDVAKTVHFGGAKLTGSAQAYASSATGERRVTLIATRFTTVLATGRDAAIRAELDDLRGAVRRAALAGGQIAEDGWQERVDAADKHVEAMLEWHDRSAHTISISRLVIAADARTLAGATAECIAGDDADPQLIAACKTALASLDVGVVADQRVALALVPSPSTSSPPPAPEPAPTEPRPASTPPIARPPQASMTDGSRMPMPPIVVSGGEPATDRRPIYVGLALVMLGVGLYWNRRRRARFEREDALARGDAPPRSRDDDGDDLHAAARGDDAKPEDER